MKILVIMGSPRKGKTYKAVQQIEARMHSLGAVEFEYLWLKDVNYKPCRGCHACIMLGEQRCPLKDDTLTVEAQVLAADGLILATPVYSQQVSYLMKIFIDRYAYWWHRPRLFGKFVMGVAAGGGQFSSPLGYLKECSQAWGAAWVTGLGVAHPDALQPKRRAKLEQQTQAAADRFYAAISTHHSPAPSLTRLLWFRMWRINARALRADNPADFNYWTEKGWFQQDYYTARPIPSVRLLLAKILEPLLLRFMRSVYVGY